MSIGGGERRPRSTILQVRGREGELRETISRIEKRILLDR